MTRKEAREWMMKVYYQLDIRSSFCEDQPEEFLDPEKCGGQYEYCRKLFALYLERREEYDRLIEKYSAGWKAGRLAKTDIAVLRLGCAEILDIPDVPDGAAVNEAVELAKRYGTENAPKYINGILGQIIREEKK